MKIVIKKATVKDARSISTLLCDTISKVNSKDYTPRQIKAWVQNNAVDQTKERLNRGKIFFVLRDSRSIIGVSSINLKKRQIGSLYITPKRLGEGFGIKLLLFVENYARKHGLHSIAVHSSKTAVNFYLHEGYKKIRNVSHLMHGVNIPCVVMRKVQKKQK